MGDCASDVTLTKVMESIAEVVTRHASSAGNTPLVIEEVVAVDEVMPDEANPEKARTWQLSGGRLVATYALAVTGDLKYDTDVCYHTLSTSGDEYEYLDDSVLEQLLEGTHKELDCQVCYNLMLDPVTTACGHTLCRKCLARTLDHTLHCPVCRRAVMLPPSLHTHPSNKALIDLLNGLCPDVVASREEAVALEEQPGLGDMDTPLFVVTLAFPHCPTFLRVFEPRYRLMIRRAMETNRQFGMVMYNRSGVSQGDLGQVQFMEYGTLLRIEHVQYLPDGQSIIETRGISRFKIKSHGMLDGYAIGNVERVEDISVVEEERMEMEETALPPAAEGDVEGQVTRMPTRDLLMLGLEFIFRMQQRSAPWLHQRILDSYGGPPDDAADFPYWFASILPISDDAKYDLLKTTSVRQRLKITALWIRQMEAQRW